MSNIQETTVSEAPNRQEELVKKLNDLLAEAKETGFNINVNKREIYELSVAKIEVK